MKLYSTLKADNFNKRNRGANKQINIILDHEELIPLKEDIKIFFNYHDGKPNLYIQLPPQWERIQGSKADPIGLGLSHGFQYNSTKYTTGK